MNISIITVTWNCADTLPDCLASVARQSYQQREHIVIDGASTDGTVPLLEAHRDQFAVLISEPDAGLYDALNKGIARARGDVLGIIHADDFYVDGGVLARIATAFADPQVQAVYGDLVYVARSDTHRIIRYWKAGEFRPELLRRGWMPPHPTLFLRRSLYDRIGGFDVRYRIAADYDLMLRVLSRMQGQVVYLPEILVGMRMGGGSNRSFSNLLRKSWEDYWVLRRNGMGGAKALLWKNISKLPQFLRKGAGQQASAGFTL